MAECFINRIFEPNHAREKSLFDAAVSRRNSLIRERAILRESVRDTLSLESAERVEDQLHDISGDILESQTEVDLHLEGMYSKGYVSDPQSALNLLSILGMSWSRDVAPYLDRRCGLKGKRIVSFRKEIESKEVPHITVEWLRGRGVSEEEIKKAGGVRKIQADLEKRRSRLLELLREAEEIGMPIRCVL